MIILTFEMSRVLEFRGVSVFGSEHMPYIMRVIYTRKSIFFMCRIYKKKFVESVV